MGRIGRVIVAGSLVARAVAAQAGAPALAAVPLPPALRLFDFRTGAVAWLNDSAVAVVDMNAAQLVVAQLRTGTMARYGRAGGGPGEFRMPMFMVASPAGRLVIDDLEARRLSEFDARHAFVRAARSPGPTLRVLSWSGNVVRVGWVKLGPGGGGPTVADVNLASGASQDRFRLFERDSSIVSSEPAASSFVALAAGRDGEIIAGDPRTYRLVTFDSAGMPVRHFGRPELKPSLRTEAELDDEMAPLKGQMSADQLRAARERLAKAPKWHFELSGVEADGEGRVWVATSRGGSQTELDIFSRDGRFLGTRVVPGHIATFAFRLPWLLVVEEHQEGEAEGSFGLDLFRVK